MVNDDSILRTIQLDVEYGRLIEHVFEVFEWIDRNGPAPMASQSCRNSTVEKVTCAVPMTEPFSEAVNLRS